MVVPNFLDAGVGAVFGALLTAASDGINKVKKFKDSFKKLQLTLRRIGPYIVEIEELDRQLDRSDDQIAMFTRRLQEGLDLVRECAAVRGLDLIGKFRYERKLEEFNDSLLRWAQIDLQLRLTRDNSKILLRSETNRKKCDNDIEFGGGCGVPRGPDFLTGLDKPLGKLKAKLLDSGGEQVVVLSGPRGCGKSTVAEKLRSDEGIIGTFKDNIFFVTVSKSPNVMVIVRELFQQMGHWVREFRTGGDAINHLELTLKQLEADHILLVLDDVCPESEFPIETLRFGIPGYKILVTSRSKIDGFLNYELELLEDLDAMALFLHHSAFLQDGYSCIPYSLVKMIVKRCGGLPLALIEVGKSLRGKPVSVWNDRLTQWSGGQSIIYSNNQVHLRLQTSIDALNETDKECCMDLAAFPEDQRVAVAALKDLWAGLYNLNEDGGGVFAKLYKLYFLNLIELILPRKPPERMGELCNLRKLGMRACRELSESPNFVKELKQLEDLIGDEETAHLWEHYGTQLTNPRLKVDNENASLDRLLSTSKTIQAPASYRSTLNILSQNFEANMPTESESWPPSADLALWRTKELSFTVLTVATTTWVALEVYQFVTLASWVVMFGVTAGFLWSNILSLFNKEPPNLPGLEISEESAIKMASSFRSWLEEIVRWMFRVGAEGNWFVFAVTVAALWLASLVGGCFDFLTFLYLGIVVGMSVPVIYVNYKDEIKGIWGKIKDAMLD